MDLGALYIRISLEGIVRVRLEGPESYARVNLKGFETNNKSGLYLIRFLVYWRCSMFLRCDTGLLRWDDDSSS